MHFKRILSLFSVILIFASVSTAQTSSSTSTQPTYRLAGTATLASNFVEKGLTQTNGDPGIQTDFWFNFGSQFRMGLWGANVRYEDTPTTHFWLKANADVKVDFSQNAKMNIIYTENKFYKNNNRSGNIVGLHFDFWGWKIIYDMNSAWENTGKKSTYAGAGKDSIIWGDYIWLNEGGYTMPEGDGVTSFFDLRTGLAKKAKDILLKAEVTFSTATGDFKDQGALAFIFSASVSF
jgi:hypothetical protein